MKTLDIEYAPDGTYEVLRLEAATPGRYVCEECPCTPSGDGTLAVWEILLVDTSDPERSTATVFCCDVCLEREAKRYPSLEAHL